VLVGLYSTTRSGRLRAWDVGAACRAVERVAAGVDWAGPWTRELVALAFLAQHAAAGGALPRLADRDAVLRGLALLLEGTDPDEVTMPDAARDAIVAVLRWLATKRRASSSTSTREASA
jgi:hypothetical protein